MRNLTYELRKEATWDEELLKVQAILNNKVSEATGLTPNQIIFAGQIDLLEGRIYPQPTQEQRISMSAYMKQQINFQDELMKMARENQDEANRIHMSDSKDRYLPLSIGNYVVVRHEDGKAPTKLSVRWHGPYRVISFTQRLQGTVYTCYCPTTGRTYDFHASVVQIHPCLSDKECVKSKVLDDENLFIPEEILRHEIKGANQLNLLIKWAGDKQPEWSGLNIDLKRNSDIQAYLKKHGLEEYGLKKPIDQDAPYWQDPDEVQEKRVSFSATTY
jgi:hypothetical protein